MKIRKKSVSSQHKHTHHSTQHLQDQPHLTKTQRANSFLKDPTTHIQPLPAHTELPENQHEEETEETEPWLREYEPNDEIQMQEKSIRLHINAMLGLRQGNHSEV